MPARLLCVWKNSNLSLISTLHRLFQVWHHTHHCFFPFNLLDFLSILHFGTSGKERMCWWETTGLLCQSRWRTVCLHQPEENVSAAKAKMSKRQAAAGCWLFRKYTVDNRDWESKSQSGVKKKQTQNNNNLGHGCWKANLIKTASLSRATTFGFKKKIYLINMYIF